MEIRQFDNQVKLLEKFRVCYLAKTMTLRKTGYIGTVVMLPHGVEVKVQASL